MSEKIPNQIIESTNESPISVCDIMKNNTSDVIKKLESNVPNIIQNYSDLYKEYLHMVDDFYGNCYLAEKKFFGNENIEPGALRKIQENLEVVKNNYIENVGLASKLFNESIKMRISAIRSFDKYLHFTMESYSKMLSQFKPAP